MTARITACLLCFVGVACSPDGSPGGDPARGGPEPPSGEVPFVRPGTLVENAEYASRRARLMDEVPDGIALIPGATTPLTGEGFFQSNDFLYFTGAEAPDAWLVVDGERRESTLFLTLNEHDAEGEGVPRELVLDPVSFTGIEAARPAEELEEFLRDRVGSGGVICLSHRPEELHRMNTNEVFNAARRVMMENPWDGRLTRELQLVERLKERLQGVEIRDCHHPIQVMRKVKSPAEVALVREAARIGVQAHLEFMRNTQVGMPEGALAAVFEFVTRREGAQELAYETIVMSGEHHPWGHYHQHDRTLEDGDFIILDAGPDYAYYNADISTSFPANGRFTPEQRELYEMGLGIRQVCLDNYRPGTTFAAVGEAVAAWLEANGYDSSERRFRGLIRWGCYNHPIGMATHDVMSSMTGPEEPLEPGFVFACDINIPQTETLGIRIEDTVVITEDGYENLSAGLPRTVKEIETFMREEGLLQKVGRGE
ncbi:MAG: aminopeptidase P N-terminal domain-containing protein [Longimicrobiales bacterium]